MSRPSRLVWDTSPLFRAIKAERIDRLAYLARETAGSPRHNVTTEAVVQELAYHDLDTSCLDWLEVVHVDGLKEIGALVRWMGLVSGEKSNHGEATVLAWAEVHGATAVVDDLDARRVAQGEGMPARATEYEACAFVDALATTGARYPFGPGEFPIWARSQKLL